MDETNIKRMLDLLYKKMQQYNDGKYGDFFIEDSEDFLTLISLVYMLLLKEEIITKDKKNPNVHSRLKLNVDSSIIDNLIDSNGLRYLCDQNGKDAKWLYDSIRDSILHGTPIINFDTKTVHIKNDKKALECDISFDFFNNIAGKGFINSIILNPNEYNIDIILSNSGIYDELYGGEFIKKDSISNHDEFNKYIKLLKHYTIKFSPKNRLQPLANSDITRWDLKRLQDEIEISFLPKCEKMALDNYFSYMYKDSREKKNSNNDYYSECQKYFDLLFCENLTKLLNEKYQNFSFEIKPSSIPLDKSEFLYSKRIDDYSKFFKLDFLGQHIELTRKIKEIYNESEREQLLSAFNDLSISFNFAKRIPQETDPIAKELAISYLNGNKINILELHKLRIKLNLTQHDTYDNVYLSYGKKINNYNIYISLDDFNKLKDKMPYLKDYQSDFYVGNIRLSDIKKVDKQIYDKYVELIKSGESYSDQDYLYFRHRTYETAMQIRDILNAYYYVMPILFLYVLGTGIYSINKEKEFEHNTEFIDIVSSNITCYSSSYFNSNKDIMPRLQKIISDDKQKVIELEKNLTNCSSAVGKEKIKEKIEIIQQKINQNEFKLNSPIISKNGINYQATEPTETLTRLRDVFSHLDRIKIIDFSNKKIELVDYNDNNQPVAIIQTDIKTIFKIFKLVYKEKVINEETQKTRK